MEYLVNIYYIFISLSIYNNLILDEKQKGFSGEPTTLGEFVTEQSGNFTDESTWQDKVVPYGDCNVTIASGTTVTLDKSVVDVNMKNIDVYGTLILGSSKTDDITFRYAPNIIVHGDGTIVDQTNKKLINLPELSLLTIYPNGSFEGDNTVVATTSKSRSASTEGRRITFGSKFRGPKTCGILPGGEVQSFPKVTYMVSKSGSCTHGKSYCGGKPPTRSICAFVGGCGLSISSGFTLETAALNGELNINFDLITVAVGATFALGTSGSSAGFKFGFKFQFNCFGTLADVTGGTGGIFLPVGTAFNMFGGAIFTSLVATSIKTYIPGTTTILSSMSISASFSGPFFVAVSTSGSISTSTTGE